MDTNDLRALFTVISLITFVAIVIWAYSSKNKGRLDEAAQLPFTEDESLEPEKGSDHHQGKTT